MPLFERLPEGELRTKIEEDIAEMDAMIGSTNTTPMVVVTAPAVCRMIVPIAIENRPSTIR